MVMQTMDLPVKTRDIKNAIICDSTRWKYVRFRDDDIVVATYGKTGTTWMQQIVGQLIFRGDDAPLWDSSPWVDMRPVPLEIVLETIEAQKHRRLLKTHLPIDGAGCSLPRPITSTSSATAGTPRGASTTTTPGSPIRPIRCSTTCSAVRARRSSHRPCDVVQDFHEWLTGGGLPLGVSFWEHVQGGNNARHLPNVLLVHFNNLKADLPGQMRRIAAFLGIEIDESRFPAMIEHCGIDDMRRAASAAPVLDMVFKDGSTTFFNKGTDGRWKDGPTAADLPRVRRKSCGRT